MMRAGRIRIMLQSGIEMHFRRDEVMRFLVAIPGGHFRLSNLDLLSRIRGGWVCLFRCRCRCVRCLTGRRQSGIGRRGSRRFAASHPGGHGVGGSTACADQKAAHRAVHDSFHGDLKSVVLSRVRADVAMGCMKNRLSEQGRINWETPEMFAGNGTERGQSA